MARSLISKSSVLTPSHCFPNYRKSQWTKRGDIMLFGLFDKKAVGYRLFHAEAERIYQFIELR
jgi:hypothetical protein